MYSFELNSTNSVKELKFNSKDSYVLIKSISIFSDEKLIKNWFEFLSKIEIVAELYYKVYVDSEGRFIDDRTFEFPVELKIDPHQVQPVFNCDIQIKNKILTIGSNPKLFHYSELRIKLIEKKPINENYNLKFVVDVFNN